MGDIRSWLLWLVDWIVVLHVWFIDAVHCIVEVVDPILREGLTVITVKFSYQFPWNAATCFAVKFLGSIGFLILIRGGTPRYRYDYLTKLGWMKFLGLILLVFTFSTVLYFIF